MEKVNSTPLTQASVQMSPEETQSLLKLYVANPVFRSATDQELIIQDNPYRRAVRPQDLEFLDYRKPPLKADQVLYLRALIGHRMLFNIYETDLVFLPKVADPSIWNEFELFYSNDNKVLGERVRPALETHLFHFLDEESPASESWSADSLKEYFCSIYQSYKRSGSRIADVVLSAHDRERVATTFLIQLLGAYLSGVSAMTRGLLGDYGSFQVQLSKALADGGYTYNSDVARRTARLKSMIRSCGLNDQPHAYWQFYLSSSLALANYSHYVARDHSKFFRYIGALFYQEMRFDALREQQSRMLHEVFGPRIDTGYFDEPRRDVQDYAQVAFDELLTPLLTLYGNRIVQDLARGFEDFRRLHEIAEDDFIVQVTWADQPDLYKDKARRIYDKIRTENLQVPLDAFVEHESETSTTHTHDLDRLLVIETGVMHFWSSFGPPMVFNPGDMTLVPRQRLHGSTVLSGECTYHQPIISSELMREFEKMF